MERIKGIVNGSSAPKEFMGVMQIGFTLVADTKKWYNVQGEEEALIELREAVVTKGAEISFEYEEKGKQVGDITLISPPKAQSHDGNWADDMTSFEDLLADGHKKFGARMHIRTEIVKDGNGILQIDYEKKRVVFKAQVYIQENALTDKSNLKDYVRVFEGHGDAEGITNDTIKPHWIRMAETRALARALRFATNNAKVAVEETGGDAGAPAKEEKKEAKKDAKTGK